jgi:osmotically-inducible protein OsmY
MRKATSIFSSLALTAVLVMSAAAQSAKPAKHMAAQKSDADIQSCIESKVANAPKLKDQGFGVSTSNGIATFTGTTKNSGSKSSINSIAKSCGAKQVANNIIVEKAASSASGGTKKAAKPKK